MTERASWPIDAPRDETHSRPYKVVALRATGVTPEAVALEMEDQLSYAHQEGWALERVEPVIYNSSTTGYFLLVFCRLTDRSGV